MKSVPINLDCEYPVESAMLGSAPVGVSGTERGADGPMHVEMLDVNAKVFGRPACARRRRESVSV